MPLPVELVIVGGGILGLCVGWLAEKEGLQHAVIRLSDVGVPHADTLRNQGWLQSGLRYMRDDGDEAVAAATRMRRAGEALHEALSLAPPTGSGILRARDEADARNFLRRGQRLLLPVRRLSDDECAPQLGPLFEPGAPYLAVPELPFDEAQVLHELRARITTERVGIGRAQLTKTPSRHLGFSVLIDGTPIDAKCVVLAAGCGNKPLLESLGVGGVKLSQTPLLVLPAPASFTAPLFYDRLNGLSIVRHDTSEGRARLVIGTRDSTRALSTFVEPPERQVLHSDAEACWTRLPPSLQELRGDGRVTAGVEPAYEGLSDIHTWITDVDTFPGLIAALPGRATVALDAAAVVVEHVKRHLATTEQQPPAQVTLETLWRDPIHMHFESHFDETLNDARPFA